MASHQRGLGLGGLIHGEAHPVIRNLGQPGFKYTDAWYFIRLLVQSIPWSEKILSNVLSH